MQESLHFFEKVMQGFAALATIKQIPYQYNERELVFQYNKVKLYHYRPKVKKANTTPLLVVFATVNRPEILDLFPEHSFIGGLLKNGMDVFLLDWGYPDANDKDIAFSEYVTDYLHHCVEFMMNNRGVDKINLAGICQGGVICLCYAALWQDHIQNLVLISTPIDFDTSDNTVGALLKRIDFNQVTKIFGNVPGMWLNQFFVTLRPFELIGKKYLHFVDHIENPEVTHKFLCVEKWLQDAPDQAGKAFREFVRDFYQCNKLIKGEIILNNKKVNLMNITMPVLNIMAEEDEIVPMSASRPLNHYIGTKAYSQQVFPSGHIGIYVSDKVGGSMSLSIAQWLKKHELG